MSGIRVGTRLEQLLRLRDRIDHEIAIERRKPTDHHTTTPTPTALPTPADLNTEARLLRLGTTPKAVKQWAVTVGLLDRVPRGRVHRTLVDAYEAAHTTQEGIAS